jgi:hypothetical protein
MIDIDTVSILTMSAGVSVVLVYYAFQLRHQTKLRQTDLINRLESNRDSRELEKSVLAIMRMMNEAKDYDGQGA